ncbi:hypothetical protein [Streptomyces sp. VRA16 Mangrove soil]|uniref:hypothetical protein n=1 Tax=Streptomyces sp. VRA16 Mangrove soil TaxID=2817434 RepID=UPI001A9F6600|nr:hypothetical protein [Streptomyces sp. VRA16 Mangrove soil]MBO1333566.1 hypothetical protein [Streptomyces sp. VRA16 Mangrove soil]
MRTVRRTRATGLVIALIAVLVCAGPLGAAADSPAPATHATHTAQATQVTRATQAAQAARAIGPRIAPAARARYAPEAGGSGVRPVDEASAPLLHDPGDTVVPRFPTAAGLTAAGLLALGTALLAVGRRLRRSA